MTETSENVPQITTSRRHSEALVIQTETNAPLYVAGILALQRSSRVRMPRSLSEPSLYARETMVRKWRVSTRSAQQMATIRRRSSCATWALSSAQFGAAAALSKAAQRRTHTPSLYPPRHLLQRPRTHRRRPVSHGPFCTRSSHSLLPSNRTSCLISLFDALGLSPSLQRK